MNLSIPLSFGGILQGIFLTFKMFIFNPILILLLVLLMSYPFILKYFKNKTGEVKDDITKNYIKRPYLMTQAEHEFFKVLQQAVQDKYYIVPQVQLSNLVQVEKPKRWEYSLRNKIDRKSVDFVLFDKDNFTPYLVIELDDNSHLREDRQIRDGFVDRVLNKTGIKIVHIKTAYSYNLSVIADELKL